MYTRWTAEHTNFIKNNLNISDKSMKDELLTQFGFDVTEEAVKKKRQRMNLPKKVGRKINTTIEKEEEPC